MIHLGGRGPLGGRVGHEDSVSRECSQELHLEDLEDLRPLYHLQTHTLIINV